jgi:hypothetical protein
MVRTMIEFPCQRVELLDRLQLLADEGYQWRYWGSSDPHFDFDYIVHFFFDDTPLAELGAECIGKILEDEHEVMLSNSICKKINNLLETYGRNQADEFYMNTTEWKEVIRDARKFLEYLREPPIFEQA